MIAASRTQDKNSTEIKRPVGVFSSPAGLSHSSVCSCQESSQGVLFDIAPDSSNVPDWWAGIPTSRPLASGGATPVDRGKVGGESVSSPTLALASPVDLVGGTGARRSGNIRLQTTDSGAVSSCLDLIETSGQDGQARRVGWGPLRRDSLKLVGALRAAGEEGRAVRMESCSREWMAYRHVPTKNVILRSNRCRDRFCLVCMSLRSAAMVRRFDSIIEKWPVVRMMTFTVRSSDNLKEQIGFLRGCFRELRRRRAWKLHVDGYLVTLEVTHGEAGWHAHLHVLYQGAYWDFTGLKAEWKAVTKNEGSVDIRIAGSIKEALKYVVKPKAIMALGEKKMCELIEVMRGVRCLSTGGTLRGIVTEEELDSDDEMGMREEYEPIGRLDGIVERYRAGDRSPDVVDTVKLAVKLGILERVEFHKPYGLNRRKSA